MKWLMLWWRWWSMLLVILMMMKIMRWVGWLDGWWRWRRQYYFVFSTAALALGSKIWPRSGKTGHLMKQSILPYSTYGQHYLLVGTYNRYQQLLVQLVSQFTKTAVLSRWSTVLLTSHMYCHGWRHSMLAAVTIEVLCLALLEGPHHSLLWYPICWNYVIGWITSIELILYVHVCIMQLPYLTRGTNAHGIAIS